MSMKRKFENRKVQSGGFTLLELLIVISIVAILSVALIIVLNPAETLRKARDAQRISDLNNLKSAIGIYMTNTASPILGSANNASCKTIPSTARGAAGTFKIYYSLPSTSAITDVTLDGSTVTTPAVQVATPALTSGSGWIPVNFDGLTGGSPISNIPVDPTNTIASLSAVASTDLVYRYTCSVTPLAFEIASQLESTAYTVTEDKRATDGGNNANYYEVGTNLQEFSTGTDF